MKVFSSAGVAAALIVSSAAFAVGAAAAQPAKASPAVSRHAMAPHAIPDATRALNLLEAQGYGNFTNFRRAGNDYDATVSQNGKTFPVTVDPATGQITRG